MTLNPETVREAHRLAFLPDAPECPQCLALLDADNHCTVCKQRGAPAPDPVDALLGSPALERTVRVPSGVVTLRVVQGGLYLEVDRAGSAVAGITLSLNELQELFAGLTLTQQQMHWGQG